MSQKCANYIDYLNFYILIHFLFLWALTRVKRFHNFAQCISIPDHFQVLLKDKSLVYNGLQALHCLLHLTSNRLLIQVTPFLKSTSFLCLTWTFKDGLYLQMNSASWIFLLSQFAEDVVKISHVKLSSGFSFKQLATAESCVGSSCWFHLRVVICEVSPMQVTSGFFSLVPLQIAFALVNYLIFDFE